MTDGKIYIYVTDKAPSETPSKPNASPNNNVSNKRENDILAHWSRDKIISTARNLATTCVTYSLSNIGNFTGDYITQANVNNSLQALNSLKGIGENAIAGGIIGGPIGALIGGTLALVNSSVSSALNINTQRIMNGKFNYEIAQIRDRSGLNSKLDGSRGTEN